LAANAIHNHAGDYTGAQRSCKNRKILEKRCQGPAASGVLLLSLIQHVLPSGEETVMMNAKPLSGLVLLASLAVSGCIGAPGEAEEQTATAQEAASIDNGLSGNGLSGNGLSGNGLSGNGLSGNGLSGNGLSGNGLSGNGLSGNSVVAAAIDDPTSRQLLEYIVSCALPQGEHLDVTSATNQVYGFDGQLGLAPEWGGDNGTCGTSCRQWVSACVLARVDYLGVHREISLRGADPALKVSLPELIQYHEREATYYGDIFASPPQRYACLAPGKTEIPRVCGPSIEDCVIDVVGPCTATCSSVGPFGSFGDCHDAKREHGKFPNGSSSYHGSITVFLDP
jgi:hypothetical protein